MNKLSSRGSWSLIGLLVVVVIVIVAGVLLMGKLPTSTVNKDNSKQLLVDSKSTKNTYLGQSIDTAKAHVCREQLSQIRQAILSYKSMDPSETNPPSLQALRLGVGQEFFQCPMTKQPYKYDPATGTVTCPTHTNY